MKSSSSFQRRWFVNLQQPKITKKSSTPGKIHGISFQIISIMEEKKIYVEPRLWTINIAQREMICQSAVTQDYNDLSYDGEDSWI